MKHDVKHIGRERNRIVICCFFSFRAMLPYSIAFLSDALVRMLLRCLTRKKKKRAVSFLFVGLHTRACAAGKKKVCLGFEAKDSKIEMDFKNYFKTHL